MDLNRNSPNLRTRRRRLERSRRRERLRPRDRHDRISALPDEIIHEIIARLRSPKQVAQASALSETWDHLIRSYPILEFEEDRSLSPKSKESQLRHASALLENFSPGRSSIVSLQAVRVKLEMCSNLYLDFVNRILKLAAASSSVCEIDIDFGSTRYSIPQSVFIPNDDQKLQRLKVLKLRGCRFDQYEGVAITSLSSLEVLCLENVTFRDSLALKSMIAGAPFLQTLTLEKVTGDKISLSDVFSFDSPMPNLKVLRIMNDQGSQSDAEVIRKRVSELPSLELLEFVHAYSMDELTIVNNYKLQEIRLENVSCNVEIDVRSLRKLCYGRSRRTIRFPEIYETEETEETEENLPLIQYDQRLVEQRKQRNFCTGQEEEIDRISTLPDEVIHRILAGIRSFKEVMQVNVLSKRWAGLLRSYPILEFDEDYYFGPKEPQERFAIATLEKFSPQGGNISMEAVRVKIQLFSDFYSDFLDHVLELAARSSSLEEIDIEFGKGLCYSHDFGYYLNDQVRPYYIPVSFFLPSPPNKEQFLRLNVLKLTDCNFHRYDGLVINEDDNPFSSLGSSLKVLNLCQVCFPGDTVLNSIIAAASRLETLTLDNIYGMKKLRLLNRPNLKAVDLLRLYAEGVEIRGAPSLEKVLVSKSVLESVQISSTPNLKELFIAALGDKAINKLIEEPTISGVAYVG